MTFRRITFLFVAALCAFAALNAGAQRTNEVTFSAEIHEQGTNAIVNGTNTVYAKPTVIMENNARLLQELGQAVNPANGFSGAARLVLITNPGVRQFAVIDGTNFYDISLIMSVANSGYEISSGKLNLNTGLAFPKTNALETVELTYDDTGTALGANGLKFDLTGFASSSTTDTAPAGNGSYTETFKATIDPLLGNGSLAGTPFIMTGDMSVSGKGTITP